MSLFFFPVTQYRASVRLTDHKENTVHVRTVQSREALITASHLSVSTVYSESEGGAGLCSSKMSQVLMEFS